MTLKKLSTPHLDENGLCPACRQLYLENPANFKPLTSDELQNIKSTKKQKEMVKKQKLTDSRKHLANVRVVQKNLLFVVGLSQRLADPELLKRGEYFGKYGKIHKIVVNSNTSYAGNSGPSASAYITFYKVEDALRAIQAVNNITVDGRCVKASLGTTKYCSHYLKGTTCPKSDCLYLHELGDGYASFTKEEMQQGKHTDYENRLFDDVLKPKKETNVATGQGKDQWPSSSEEQQPAVQTTVASTTVTQTQNTKHTPPRLKKHKQESSVKKLSHSTQCNGLTGTSPVEDSVLSAAISNDDDSLVTDSLNSWAPFEQTELIESCDAAGEELDFDPWNESSKGLREIIAEERQLTTAPSQTDGLVSTLGLHRLAQPSSVPQPLRNHTSNQFSSSLPSSGHRNQIPTLFQMQSGFGAPEKSRMMPLMQANVQHSDPTLNNNPPLYVS